MPETDRHDKAREKEPGIVIEASWAPQDPRDRLYDSNATKGEKRESLFRIVAAFHPVLNFPVICMDAIRLFGPLRSAAFLIVMVAVVLAVVSW